MKILDYELFKFLHLSENQQKALAEAFNNLGYEVDAEASVSNINDFLVAKVSSAVKHPNADNLKFCKLKSEAKNYNVVCGGKNIAKGQTVIYAPMGAAVGNVELSLKEIRGIESMGMVLSLAEILGIKEEYIEIDEKENIFVVQEKNSDRKAIEKQLKLDAKIYDLSILNDRKYANSYLMLAKELNAYFKIPYNFPIYNFQKNSLIEPKISLRLDTNALGLYFVAVELNQKIQTPQEIKIFLYKNNIQPQNTIRDLLSYVSLIVGNVIYYLPSAIDQLHLKDNFLNTIDLFNSDVMQNTDLKGYFVASSSEYFKNLSMQKEINYPFGIMQNRGTNSYLLKYSLEMLLSLGQQYGYIADNSDIFGKELIIDKNIFLSDQEIFNYIGEPCDLITAKAQLQLLDFKIDNFNYQIPGYRLDIQTKEDLIEEIIRMYGINNIKAQGYELGEKAILQTKELIIENLTKTLVKYNFSEVKTYQLIEYKEAKRFNFWDNNNFVLLLDKYNFKFNTLRTSLFKSLLDVHLFNYRNEESDLNFFEISNLTINDQASLYLGAIYDDDYYPSEPVLIAKKMLFVIAELLDIDYKLLKFKEFEDENFNKYLSAKIYYKGAFFAILGEISPQILREYKYIRVDKIKRKLYYLECKLV